MKSNKPSAPPASKPSESEIHLLETMTKIEQSIEGFHQQSLTTSERLANAIEKVSGAFASLRAINQRQAEYDRSSAAQLEIAVAAMQKTAQSMEKDITRQDFVEAALEPLRVVAKNTELALFCCETQRSVLHKIEKSVSGIARLDEIALLLKQLLHTIQNTGTQDPSDSPTPSPSAPTDQDNVSIGVLKLPIRIHNCLLGSDILTIKDLKSRNEQELLNIPNMGFKSVLELSRALYRYDFENYRPI